MGKNQDPGSGINIPDPPHCHPVPDPCGVHSVLIVTKERKCSGKGWKDLDGISVHDSVMRFLIELFLSVYARIYSQALL
jgi:hypothetical protein